MNEYIDRKFKFKATSIKSGKVYTQKNALVFLVKDALLPDLLDKYLELCLQRGVDDKQVLGVQLLKDRVLKWQRTYPTRVQLPGVALGDEEKRVCKPNR